MTTEVRDGFAAARLLDHEAGAVVEDWRQLCRWDPGLPPDADPPDPEPVIAALADALRRPQPLGWGADLAVADAMEAFTDRAGPLAVGELVCLREAVSRRLRGRLPAEEAEEAWSRLQMTVDRAMACAARRGFELLEEAASVDPLTGAGNRRSFERDLRREIGRTARHGGRFALVLLDLDGLKVINDTDGHAAGDVSLRSLAAAVRSAIRTEDSVYRIGGDEFAVLLPQVTAAQAETVMGRVADLTRTPFTWGVASCPEEGLNPDALAAVADSRLYARRRRRRR